MNYDDTKRLLDGIRHYKKIIQQFKEELAEMRINCDLLMPLPGRKIAESAENIFLQYEGVQERLAETLSLLCGSEAKISAAIQELTPKENKVIVGYYLKCYNTKLLGTEMFYDERTIRRIKRNAIHKIAKNLE